MMLQEAKGDGWIGMAPGIDKESYLQYLKRERYIGEIGYNVTYDEKNYTL